MSMVKHLPQPTSIFADAYLTPAIQEISGFQTEFEDGLGTDTPASLFVVAQMLVKLGPL